MCKNEETPQNCAVPSVYSSSTQRMVPHPTPTPPPPHATPCLGSSLPPPRLWATSAGSPPATKCGRGLGGGGGGDFGDLSDTETPKNGARVSCGFPLKNNQTTTRFPQRSKNNLGMSFHGPFVKTAEFYSFDTPTSTRIATPGRSKAQWSSSRQWLTDRCLSKSWHFHPSPPVAKGWILQLGGFGGKSFAFLGERYSSPGFKVFRKKGAIDSLV